MARYLVFADFLRTTNAAVICFFLLTTSLTEGLSNNQFGSLRDNLETSHFSTKCSSCAGETLTSYSNVHDSTFKKRQQQARNRVMVLDESCWKEYDDLLMHLFLQPRVLKKCRSDEAKAVQMFLLDRTWPLDLSDILSADCFEAENSEGCFSTVQVDREKAPNDCKYILKERRVAFVNTMNFTKRQSEYMDRCFHYIGDRCASTQQSAPLQIAWPKWRLTGSIPREKALSTYMYVLGLGDKQSKSFSDVLLIHSLLYPPNEKTVTLRVQLMISENNPTGAEKLINSLSSSSNKSGYDIDSRSKLRTYSPILSYYCEKGDMTSALRLFRQMSNSKGVHLDVPTYTLLLTKLASLGYFKKEKALLGQPVTGTKFFDELVSQMANDVLELTEDAASDLYLSFESGCKDTSILNTSSIEGGNVPVCPDFEGQQLLAGRVFVNETSGLCSRTGTRLRLLTLDDEQRQQVRDTLVEMAYSTQQDFLSNIREKNYTVERPSADYCREEIQKFSNWVSATSYTAFVDGANVAFFRTGFVEYSQVKLVVDTLEKMGEKPLVIMPSKYVAKNFYLRHKHRGQELNDNDEAIVNELVGSGKLYKVPSFCFDDYYWMIATVSNQNASQTKAAPGSYKGANPLIPGLRPVVVTNDQMRDHRMALLETRPFRRWTSCHIVNYSIKHREHFQSTQGPAAKVAFFPPKAFSREIQCNEIPDTSGRQVWHFPVTGWDDTDRMCISLGEEY